ncbi:MAG: DUF4239 domain-containing protein [Candidatus Melainabacteria bacterium]|nr:DUF4239 domain-containing protein [Candidatus Melainabacteria bacterium]
MVVSPLLYWGFGFVVIALAGLYASTKLIKIDMDKNGELIVAMLTILGTLVSILLGLLVSNADEQYRALEECVNNEATSINEVFRLARGLPADKCLSLQKLCVDYCDKVISEEFPAMRTGERSATVTDIYTHLSDEMATFQPAKPGEETLQSSIIQITSDVGQNRAKRILACRSNWASRLLPLIVACAVVVLACSYLYAGQGSQIVHSVLVGLVAVTLGINIGVIFLMTRPFSSEWAIEPESFRLHNEVMKQFLHSRPKDDFKAIAK